MPRALTWVTLILLAALAGRTPAAAQVASCPPPLKWAAGACVTACPGGFEDRGRDCVYRSGR